MYDPIYKEDTLPYCDPKIKQTLDLHYYPQNYELKQGEGSLTLQTI